MRITIDTGELRSLAAVYRQVAGDVRGRASSVQRAVDETSLNLGDRRLARAGVPVRVHEVARSVERVAGQLEGQASAIERRAQLLELDQGGGIPVWFGVLLPAAPIAWAAVMPERGHAPWSLGVVHRSAALTSVAGVAAALTALGPTGVVGRSAGLAVNRGVAVRLVASLRRAAGVAERWGRKVVHLTAAAWRSGLAASRAVHRRVLTGLAGVVTRAATALITAMHVRFTVGRFVTGTTRYTLGIVKALPRHGLVPHGGRPSLALEGLRRELWPILHRFEGERAPRKGSTKPWTPPGKNAPAVPTPRKVPPLPLPRPQGPQKFSGADAVKKAQAELGTVRETGWNMPGECVKSVQRWITLAGGRYVGGLGPFGSIEASGAIRITDGRFQPGDVIQIATPGHGWDGSVHTALISAVHPDGSFDIIESNFGHPKGKVGSRSNLTLDSILQNTFKGGPTPGAEVHVYRMGQP